MKHAIAAVAFMACCVPVTTAVAEETMFAQFGEVLRFGGLVPDPDVALRYVAHDPGGAVTLAMEGRECTLQTRPQITLRQDETQEIFLKHECNEGRCRAYVAAVRWLGTLPSGEVWFKYAIKIVASRGS